MNFLKKETNVFLFPLISSMALLKDIKKRRIELGFKQKDMQQRIGVSRQQYQQIESKGNPQPAS